MPLLHSGPIRGALTSNDPSSPDIKLANLNLVTRSLYEV